MPILVTFMRADTEVPSRMSSAHEPGGAPRAAILALLCALGAEAVHRCNTAEVRGAWYNAPLSSGTRRTSTLDPAQLDPPCATCSRRFSLWSPARQQSEILSLSDTTHSWSYPGCRYALSSCHVCFALFMFPFHVMPAFCCHVFFIHETAEGGSFSPLGFLMHPLR